MKITVIILFSIFQVILVIAQPKLNVDSLRKNLFISKDDSSRILIKSQISSEFVFYKPDSALKFVKEALQSAQKINYFKGKIYCEAALGKLWWSVGDYASALRLLLPLTKSAEIKTDHWLRINTWAFIIASYRDQRDFKEALKYAYEFAFLEKAYNNCKACRHCNTAIASIYLEMRNTDSVIFYLKKAFNDSPVFGDDGWMNMVAGRLYTNIGKIDSAFYFYQQSIPLLVAEENQKDLSGTYNNIASLFNKIGNRDSAFYYADKALIIALPRKYLREIMSTYLLLSELYEPLKVDSALYYHKLSMIAKDSLYNQEKQRQIASYQYTEELREQEIKHTEEQYKTRLRMYTLVAAVVLFLIIAVLLWKNNQHKQKAYLLLQEQKFQTDIQKEKAEKTLAELQSTQAQLIQSEKMASLGELTAGIAHEIQNPLNFVNNFSEVNKEMIDEATEEINKGNVDEVKNILNDIKDNEEKINHHGKRADAIVKGMLQHSRQTTGVKEPTDINALCDEYLRLSYHGLRAKDKSFNADFKTDLDESLDKINIVPQNIGRVLLNLFNNSFYTVNEKSHQLSAVTYQPMIKVQTKKLNDKVEIVVADNGNGIPQNIIDKIFQPFFTTKPTGQGTGLGLSLAYDIITKEHGGSIKVESKEGEGTTFIIQLPV